MADQPSWRSFWSHLGALNFHVVSIITSHLEGWNPDEFGSEAGIIEAIKFYQYHVCGKIFMAEANQTGEFASFIRALFLNARV